MKESVVLSPKSERLGEVKRKVPIFLQARPCFENACRPDSGGRLGFPIVSPPTRACCAVQGFWSEFDLWQRFLGILELAGVSAWPKLIHQMRSSCQTDLTNRFPSHTVCGWLGNTVEIANAHYLQTIPEHWAASIEMSSCEQTSSKSAVKSAVNWQETGVNVEEAATGKAKNPLVLAGFQENEWRIGDLNP
jgi:hypothetical protein